MAQYVSTAQAVSMASDVPRPSMRRKSSAQNLLSTFKSPSISTVVSPPGSFTSSTPTPTASSMGRDWDAQSLHSDSVTGASSPSLTQQGTSVEYIRDLVQKRILTLTYIRNIHEGTSHWFNTVYVTSTDLARVFNNQAMKKRTKHFTILAMSLSSLFDIHQPQDFLRALTNALNEYEQIKEDSDKPKMRLFKYKLAKRQAGFAEYSSVTDTTDASYLIAPHMPFQLDYHEVLVSLLDVLSEVYHKISKLMGPSAFSRSEHMLGPLGLLSPHPGITYLDVNRDSTLWTIAHGGGASSIVPGGAQQVWTPILGEMVLKVDAKLKKISSMLLKELDTFARNSIKDELASLGPLLRNADDGRQEVYDFET